MRAIVILFGLLMSMTLAHAQAAIADDKSGALMLFGGNAPEMNVTRATVAELMAAAGWKLKDVKFTDRDMVTAAKCPPGDKALACVKPILARHGIARMVAVKLSLNRVREELSIQVQLFVPGTVAVEAERFCNHCTDDTLREGLRFALKEANDMVAIASGRTVLEVITVPSGAMFAIDDRINTEKTNAKVAITPGVHKVRVQMTGFAVEEREVVGIDGATTKLEVTLTPGNGEAGMLAGTPGPQTPPSVQNAQNVNSSKMVATAPVAMNRPSRVGPVVVITAGALAVAAGIYVITQNEQPPDAPANQQQPSVYYKTLVPGSITVVAGAVTVGLGYLWWRRTAPSPIVVAPVAGGGASIGFTGTF